MDELAAQGRAALRQARQAAGLTQEELARRAGITRSQLQVLESDQGNWNPRIRTIYALAAALNIPPTSLVPPAD